MDRRPFDTVIKKFWLRHIADTSRVLDTGCGTGKTVLFLARQKPNCLFDGIDSDNTKIRRAKALLRKAKRKATVHYHRCSVEKLTPFFGPARYDVVISNHSLHHYQEPLIALRQIRASLKPHGSLLLTELEPAYGETLDNCPRHSLKKIITLIRRARLDIVSAQRIKPGVLVIRAQRRR